MLTDFSLVSGQRFKAIREGRPSGYRGDDYTIDLFVPRSFPEAGVSALPSGLRLAAFCRIASAIRQNAAPSLRWGATAKILRNGHSISNIFQLYGRNASPIRMAASLWAPVIHIPGNAYQQRSAQPLKFPPKTAREARLPYLSRLLSGNF